MDKFDRTIKNARKTHQPREHFVEDTMAQIMSQSSRLQKKGHGIRFWIPIAAGAAVVALLIFVLVPGSKTNIPGASNKAANVTTTSGGSTPGSSDTGKPESGTVPAGTDNASLANDLSSVQGAMNQENTDQNSANTALNDRAQEITVPTD